jgi:uncharacterized protein YcbX
MLYPVKSLDGMEVAEGWLAPSAGLVGDRRWRLVDLEGRVINGKRTPLIHAIRAAFDLEERIVTLATEGMAPGSFPLQPGRYGPCDWLADALGIKVMLEERSTGFPDDHDAPGPTLISTETLGQIAGWFGFGIDEARRRFRMNLEIEGCEAFWEDTLASPKAGGRGGRAPPADLPVDPYADLPPPQPLRFQIGKTPFAAVQVCRRCVVPTRCSRSGEPEIGFREAFEARRRAGLRADVTASAWNGFYRVGINTRVLESGGRVRAGEALHVEHR